jgi:ComF family protein
MNPVGSFAAALLDLVFPPRCLSCREFVEPGEKLCPPCSDTLLELPPGSCPRCAEPPPAATVGDGNLCENCQDRPPAYETLYAPFLFGAAIADVIHRFKYEDRPHYAAPLAELAAPHLDSRVAWADLVAPVPLHRKRLLQRRYDQAWLLARELARRGGKPTAPRLLKRTRATSPQVGRDRQARLANVAGAFEGTEKIRGRKLLLVDDVITTGATMEAAARAALEAGAVAVRGVAIARAM